MVDEVIKLTKCVETVDNWGNVEVYKNEDLYKLLTTPSDWTDDQVFIGEFGSYDIDELIGKVVWVGDYVFTVSEYNL